jgi:hypothetical protein
MITNRTPATIRIIVVLSISTFLSFQLQVSLIPQPEPDLDNTRRQSGDASGPQDCGDSRRNSLNFTAPPDKFAQFALLNPSAAALDQNHQDNHKQYTGD